MAPAEKLTMPTLMFINKPQQIITGSIDWRTVVVNILIDAVLPRVKTAKITNMPTGIISENIVFFSILFQLIPTIAVTSF